MSSPSSLETMFFECLRMDRPAERAAYLAQACAGDAELLRRLQKMLEAHDSSFLEQAAYVPGPIAEPPLDADGPGERIGAFRLVEQIGEGGMGTVWRAEQLEPVQRQVALKLIKAGMDSHQVVARFEAERQALALMDHPNIARVLDGGTDGRGRPFFVMDLFEGVPITRFCDEQRLALRQRLELFIPVCEAIQHAHQKGVIHRDIKPSNVLVALQHGRVVPKVIDFGIAKAVEQKLTEHTALTQHGSFVGTFEYMSPEQAARSAMGVDTRSDIYSLGVLLYELLTGTTPLSRQRLEQSPYSDILRAITDEETPKPSTRLGESPTTIATIAARRCVEPARLAGMVRGELDWIVMKALEKDRNRRYATVAELAQDVQRFLAHDPVSACPPSAGYRLRKFARKHRTKLQVAAGFLVLMVSATVVSVWLAIAAKRESDQKELARAEAAAATIQALDALAALTDGMLERLLARQVQLTAQDREYLRAVLARYERFAALKGDSEESRAIAAEGAFRVGLLHLRLEDRDAAHGAFRAALARYRQLGQEFPQQAKYRLCAAKACTNLGILLRERGQWDESAAMERCSLETSEQLAAEFPAEPEYLHSVAGSYLNLAMLWESQGLVDRALLEVRQARAMFEQLAQSHPGPERQRELAMCLGNLASTLRRQGDKPEAVAAYRRALEIVTTLVHDVDDSAGYRQELARCHNNLGTALMENGDAAAAHEQVMEALRQQLRLAADFPTVPSYRVELARSHANLGVFLNDADPTAAESHFRSALAIQERLVADFSDVPSHAQDLASTHNGLGNLLLDAGKLAAGEAELLAAVRMREQLAGSHPRVVEYTVELGGSYCNLGNGFLVHRQQPAESLAWYGKAIEGLTAVLATQPDLATARAFLRNSYEGRYQALRLVGRIDEALLDVDRCLALCDGAAGALVRLGRFEVLIGVDTTRAMAELDRVATEPTTPDATLYHGVVVLCQVASAEAGAQARSNYCKRAMALLEQLLRRGYLRPAANRERLCNEPAVGVLRDQDEFWDLMERAEK
ncbi:MAG TPA: serine/threonine-protein kinase [Planctomycetota bacterium]|nr:serine/threonine-protein kinase [Planctomycetota bacterium]